MGLFQNLKEILLAMLPTVTLNPQCRKQFITLWIVWIDQYKIVVLNTNLKAILSQAS